MVLYNDYSLKELASLNSKPITNGLRSPEKKSRVEAKLPAISISTFHGDPLDRDVLWDLL